MAARCLHSLRGRILGLIAVIALIGVVSCKDDARPAPGCTEASASDTLVGMTQFLGNKNTSDSVWHDELPFFRQYGPLSKFTLYRAFFYDGEWHDPGELKGMQFWYGPNKQPPIYTYQDGDANLLGARKPHLPQEFALQPGELVNKVELQWDPISMRYAVFYTNKGRALSWGFRDVAGATKAVAEAPVPGAYVAAIRGFEGKPAPVSKKRYILQVSVVWAVPSCKPPGTQARSSIPLEAARVATVQRPQGPTNVYMLDKESVSLIPEGIEASNLVYAGVSITPPADDAVAAAPAAPVSAHARSAAPLPATTAATAAAVAQSKPAADQQLQQQAATAATAAVKSTNSRTPKQVPAAAAAAVATAAADKKAGCISQGVTEPCDTGLVLGAGSSKDQD